MFEHWYSACGNYNTPRIWGLDLPTTTDAGLPATLFEAHGLDVEHAASAWKPGDAAKSTSMKKLITPEIIRNLQSNSNSRLMIQSSLEYSRVGEEPYSSAYSWLRAQGVPLDRVIVLTCSEHLREAASAVWSDIEFAVLDWWEFGPRWWHKDCEPTASATQRFTCLNRRPMEWRAALTQRLSVEPAYWDNAVHTIGNRNYHALDNDLECRDFMNQGEGYFNEEIEGWWKTWLKFPRREIQLPNSEHFLDDAVYNAARGGSLNIVTESYPHQPRHSPTEKTYRCYAVARPHITLGHYNWNQNLLDRGYLPYPWDAHYNNLSDPNERMYAVVDVILKFANMSNKQFKREMRSVEHIVQHNHRNWKQRTEAHTVNQRLPKCLRAR